LSRFRSACARSWREDSGLLREAMASHGFVTVAQRAEVPAGEIKYVEVNGIPIALCNVEGAIYAVGNICSHDAGPLSGGFLDGYAIECPRHGARFDVRDGKVVCLPAAVPIPTYPVQLDGETITVKVS